MRAVVFTCLICACAAFPQIFIQDTPEVNAEKARFYQLYNAAAAAAAAAPDTDVHFPSPSNQRFAPSNTHRFAVPQAHHAPNHHQFAHHAPNHHRMPHHVAQPKWTGPLAASVPAGLPGSSQVRNTPEVNAAIADFSRAYNSALANTRSAAPSHRVPHNSGHFAPSRHNTFSSHHQQLAQPKWTGPLAATVPAGLPGSGQVAETPEVMHAKAAFANAFNRQLSNVLG